MTLAQLIGLCILVGLTAGALGYVIPARLDRRARARDAYGTQIELAAHKLGRIDAWAAIIEEIQTPSEGSPGSQRNGLMPPDAWRMGSLAYSNYIVIPRTALSFMPKLWQARFLNLLPQLFAGWRERPNIRYTIALRDLNTNAFVRDMLAMPATGRSHKKKEV